MSIDWSAPIEAVHEDGRVEAVTLKALAHNPDQAGDYYTDQGFDGFHGVWCPDGRSWSNCSPKWRIRNVAPPMTDLSPETVGKLDTSTLGPISIALKDEANPGYVVWHSSEEDGGPDVGMTIGLGNGHVMWIGERTDREGGGQAIMIYGNGKLVANAGLSDRDEVIDLAQYMLAPVIRALAAGDRS